VVEAARISWRPLGRLLVEQGLLSELELEHALERQVSTGRRLGETLIDLGFVSPDALSRALSEQYGIGPTTETGFGTGLRAEIERRFDRGRGPAAGPGLPIPAGAPALELVPDPEPEEPEPAAIDPEHGYFPQLEEQWAKLAAAEAELFEARRELVALGRAAEHRRKQAVRLVERLRRRDLVTAPPVEAAPVTPQGHLVYAAVAGRYVLAECDGGPPEPDAILELPWIAEGALVVCRVGRSPLPNDPRPCVFAQQRQMSSAGA
jgi:hypothetical protein